MTSCLSALAESVTRCREQNSGVPRKNVKVILCDLVITHISAIIGLIMAKGIL